MFALGLVTLTAGFALGFCANALMKTASDEQHDESYSELLRRTRSR